MRAALLSIALVACSSGSAPAPTPTKQPVATPAVPPGEVPPPAADGGAREAKFQSAALGVKKRYRIYLPAGYETSGKRYPVFYYLHGLSLNEDDWVVHGHLDKVAADMKLDAIIVMPDGDDGFYVDGLAAVDYDKCMADGTGLLIQGRNAKHAACVRKRGYETYITKDLVAHIDSTYRTIATREGRAIAGMSMGGFGALQLAMRHQDLYAAAASHSGLIALLYGGPIPYEKGKVTELADLRTWGGPFVEVRKWMFELLGDDIANWRKVDPAALVQTLQPGKLALYIDCGTEDEFLFHNQAAYLHDLLLERKIEHEFFLGPGHHTFEFWNERTDDSLRFLRDHTSPAK